VTSDTDVLVRVCVGALGLRSLPDSAGTQACSGDSHDPGVLATNLLLEKLGVDDIRGTVHSLRADGMNVLRGARPEDYLERSRTSFANVKFVTRGGRSPGKITRISHSIRELHRIRVTLSESQGGGSHYAQSVHILEVTGVKYILRHNAKRWAYMTSYDRTHLHHLRGYGLSR
jgi:hypothetical protein